MQHVVLLIHKLEITLQLRLQNEIKISWNIAFLLWIVSLIYFIKLVKETLVSDVVTAQ